MYTNIEIVVDSDMLKSLTSLSRSLLSEMPIDGASMNKFDEATINDIDDLHNIVGEIIVNHLIVTSIKSMIAKDGVNDND